MEKNIMPLMESQSGLLNLVKALPAQSLNMAVRINIEDEIDENMMLEALRLTAMNLEYCRYRMTKSEDGTLGQYLYEGELEGIEILDYSSYNEKKVTKAIEKLGCTPFSKDLLETQLFNFKLIRTEGEKHILFFNLCHIIADAYGLMYTISYFDKVYAALSKGEEIPDPKCTCRGLIDAELKLSHSAKLEKEYARALSEFETEPHFTSINGVGSAEFVKGKNYGKAQNLTQFMVGSLPMRIPKELVDTVNNASIEGHVSPLAYYLLVLRTYLGTVSKTEDVTLATTTARRATLVQKRGGLSIAKLVTCRSNVAVDTTFGEAVRYMNIRQNDCYRNSDTNVLDYEATVRERFGAPQNSIYRSVVLTFQPYIDVQQANMKFSARYLNTGLAAFPLYINLMPMDTTGDLWAEYLYAKLYIKTDSIEKFHAFLLKFLPEGIAHPEKTIAQLVEECI